MEGTDKDNPQCSVNLKSDEKSSLIDEKIKQLEAALRLDGIIFNPLSSECFYDEYLFYALPENIRNDDLLFKEYFSNTVRFNDLILRERSKRWKNDLSGLFGEEIVLPEIKYEDGRFRRSESGYKINVEYLTSIGIDPTKVLFFRKTQPMTNQPKPELFWTSDYWEAKSGLSVEIPESQQKTAIILISDLHAINQNGGLIQDINDDSGLSVRQIGNNPFDQNLAIGKILVSSIKN